jgi:hypothetical protein
MDKKDLYILFGTIGIEAVALGVGLMLSPEAGWAIAIGGAIFAAFWFWRAWKIKTIPKHNTASLLSLQDNELELLRLLDEATEDLRVLLKHQ